MDRPQDADISRIAEICDDEPIGWTPVSRGDQTASWRWVVLLAGGGSAFVKIGWTLDSASWVRDEHLFYARARGLPFAPAMIGWDDDGLRPILALEDLSGATWPPPWDDVLIGAVIEGLSKVSAVVPPPDLPKASDSQFGVNGWPHVLEDPRDFLALGLCGREWLAYAGPTLHEAAAAAHLAGDSLLHWDVRSDNLCVRGGSAVFVDWNFACVGDPLADIASWLPSLHAEGGPAPEDVVGDPPGIGELAALFAGHFCSRAGKPEVSEAPHVRRLQKMQAATALPWAARTLGLDPPA